MKPVLTIVLLVLLVLTLSACQAFLEDYQYQPLGASSSSGPY